MSVFIRYPGGKTKAFTTSWDDGASEDIRLVQLMREYGIKGTFNLNSAMFGGFFELDGRPFRNLTLQQVKQLYIPNGMEVAVHGALHRELSAEPDQTVLWELISDRKALEQIADCPVHGMAYPYGRYNDRTMDIAGSLGIKYARTIRENRDFSLPENWMEFSVTCHFGDRDAVSLIRRFLNEQPERDAFFGGIWGHSYEIQQLDAWEEVEELFAMVSGKNDIWHATAAEIFNYTEAYRSLDYTFDGRFCRNPSAVDVWLKYNDEITVIPSGATVNLPQKRTE